MNERIALLENIARGERAIEEGRVVPHEEAKRRMKRWLE
jgi:predicted transcriptional regulator